MHHAILTQCSSPTSYMFMDKVLTQFNKLEFEFQGDTIGVLELLGGVPCSDEGAVPGGIVCRR